MIKERFVSFKTAKRLKELGFDEKCRAIYNTNGQDDESKLVFFLQNEEYTNSKTDLDWIYSAPTHQMAMAWLREEKKIFIDIITYPTSNNTQFRWVGYDNGRLFSQEVGKPIYFNSYEEAVEASLLYVLKNLI